MTTITEPKVTPNVDEENLHLELSAKRYVKGVFPPQEDEFMVDVKNVGGTNFRVNCWAQEDKPGSLSSMKRNRINRSYYVVCEKKGTKWTHRVLN